MKKLIAILLSVLMLCSVMPFAAVSAADGINIVMEISDEVVNAGDEFTVTVILENNPGIIAASVEILFDTDAIEVAGEWEDGEFYPYIDLENSRKWGASNISYGPAGTCLVTFVNGLATKDVTAEEFFTVTFVAKDDAYTGDYDLTLKYNPNNFFNIDFVNVPVSGEDGVITINGRDPEPEVPSCEHQYFDDCSAICELCGEEREVSHNVTHVAPVAATCTTDGNIEYWFCDKCGAAWLDEACTLNTNLMSVTLPANCSYGAEYVEAKPATCFEPGNTEYWYCATCDVYYADAACAIVTNAKNVIIPITHNIEYVAPVAATCTTAGNIEYWYCADCGQAWLDEYCHLNTNLKSVVLPASCSYGAEYFEAKPATCFEPGNTEYWYCANCDVYYADAACAIVTNAKNVIIPITHNIEYVAPVAATCTTAGNIEYWYCTECGQAWLDEYCHLNTNLKSVVVPASCSYSAIYTEAKAPTCAENGNTEYWYCANCDVYYADAACALVTNSKNVIIPSLPHTYADDLDVDCDVCGAIREITFALISNAGTSASEDVHGLAFRFDVADAADLALKDNGPSIYSVDYNNSYVNGYKLIDMGAIVDNGNGAVKVPAEKVVGVEGDETFFLIRIKNIPEANWDTVITAKAYYTFVGANGEVTVYTDAIANFYSNIIG